MTSKISAMTAASAMDGTEAFETVQGGATRKGLVSQVVTWVLATLKASAAEAKAATSAVKFLTPSNLANRSAFAAVLAGDQTGVADNTATKAAFATEVYDRASDYDNSLYRWTPPAGAVRLSAQLRLDGTALATATAYVAIYKNGSILRVGTPIAAIAANGARSSVTTTDLANGTDYYEAFGSLDTSAGDATFTAAGVGNYFSGEQI